MSRAPSGSFTFTPPGNGESSRRSSDAAEFHIGTGGTSGSAVPSPGSAAHAQGQKSLADAEAEAKRRKVQVGPANGYMVSCVVSILDTDETGRCSAHATSAGGRRSNAMDR
jgi:hypothetical protein